MTILSLGVVVPLAEEIPTGDLRYIINYIITIYNYYNNINTIKTIITNNIKTIIITITIIIII